MTGTPIFRSRVLSRMSFSQRRRSHERDHFLGIGKEPAWPPTFPTQLVCVSGSSWTARGSSGPSLHYVPPRPTSRRYAVSHVSIMKKKMHQNFFSVKLRHCLITHSFEQVDAVTRPPCIDTNHISVVPVMGCMARSTFSGPPEGSSCHGNRILYIV